MASFSIGRCLLGNSCLAPTHELRKWCPGCNGLIHVLCGRVLEDDEGSFKADSVVCPRCDPQKQQQQGSELFGKAYCCILSPLFCVYSNTLLFVIASLLSKEQHQPEPVQQQEQQQVRQTSRKRKNPPKPTARKSENDRNERVKIKIRRRVKIPRSQLYHILVTDEQRKMIPKNIPNKFFFFGTVVSHGKNKSSWNVKWDVLPESDNIIQNITRSKLIVVADGEEEKAITDDAKLDDVAMVDDEVESPEKEKAPSSDDIFCALEKDVIKEATTFTYQWGKSESESVTWKIMQDLEFAIDNSVSYPDKVELKFDEEELNDPTEFFFDYIFPDVKGKNQLYLAD